MFNPCNRGRGLLLACLLPATTFHVAAQNPAPAAQPATRPITLNECIQAALLRNRELQIERINPVIAGIDLDSAYGWYDPVLFARGRREEVSDIGGFDPTNLNDDPRRYEAKSYVAETGLGGYLPTGMRYDLTGNYNNTTGSRSAGIGVENFDSHKVNVGIAVSQPLLRNFWIDQGRWAIKVNKKLLTISELGVVYLTMDVVNRVQQAYYELLYARAYVDIQKDLLAARQQLLGGTRRRIEQGMMAAPDEQIAQAQVSTVVAELISASNLVVLAENNLKTLMGDAFMDPNLQRLVPTEALFVLPETLNLAEMRLRGLAKRPDLAQLRTDIERADIDIKYRHNQLFPQLDVVGGYGRKGASSATVFAPFQPQASASDAFDSVRRNDAPNNFVGAVFSLPLTRRAERANYRASKQLKEQVTLRLKQQEELVLREITDAWNLAASNLERVGAARLARENAQAALASEERRLIGGKSSLFFVLELQDSLADTQALEARAKAEYNQALSQLQFAEGSLLDAKRIVVEMGK